MMTHSALIVQRRLRVKVVPYLNFDGNCREAFTFYHQVLGGDPPVVLTHADVPTENLDDTWRDKTLHARLEFDGQEIMGSDIPPGDYFAPQGIFVSLQLKDDAKARKIYDSLSQGGTITMPIDKQPWGALFAIFVDLFGIQWMINSEEN
jgi:PhnB protein